MRTSVPRWESWLIGLVLLSTGSPFVFAQDNELELANGVANYEMRVDFDPVEKLIDGTAAILWRNLTDFETSELQFHLYLNAFKNTRTTFASEVDGQLWPGHEPIPDSFWGYIEIDEFEALDEIEVVSTEFFRADDPNPYDETVLRANLSAPVPPGGELRLVLHFRSKLPRGIARTGWVEDYFFAAQWFPKLGVFEDGEWNCHQYHAATEYYADFGAYDVQITAPQEYLVAGPGLAFSQDTNDGKKRHRFLLGGAHDFAWAASTRFLLRRHSFRTPGLPAVDVRLFLLPEHEHHGDRYLRTTTQALADFGKWFGPYPQKTLTVVDPAFQSESGGMEYPALITGGAHLLSPLESLSPELVTIHEVGHQWWYGQVANNEFEEAWLDEGITSWAETRSAALHYPPANPIVRLFGGFPFVQRSVEIPFATGPVASLRHSGQLDRMTQPSWRVRNFASYGLNSYAKPQLVLATLEGLIGEEIFMAAMRTYYERFSGRHPKTSDLIATFNEVSGQDLSWFFEETFGSSDLVDYAVASVESIKIPKPEGLFPEVQEDRELYETTVEIERRGGAKLPVELLLVFENGREARRSWDGQDRWHRLKIRDLSPLKYAQIDPDGKILLDINPVNNSRLHPSELGQSVPLATRKWTARWLFWLQNLLEVAAFLG